MMSAIQATPSDELKTTKLTLYGNHVGPAGAAAVADVIAERPEIRVVNLQTNAIGVEGAHSLATALESPECRVTKVCLGWTQNIGDQGAEVLAKALGKNRRCTRSPPIPTHNAPHSTAQGWVAFRFCGA